MVFLNKGYNKWASLVRTQNRFFSIKSTLNLDSKLSREELVLVVDEEDNPVRQATRLEVVRNLPPILFADIEISKLMAPKHNHICYQPVEAIRSSEEINAEGLLPRFY